MRAQIFTAEQQSELTRWAQELRTTALQQGNRRLRSEYGFCCLGIYCHLVNPTGWSPQKSVGEFFVVYQYREAQYPKEFYTTLPDSFRQALGLSTLLQDAFIRLNDGFRYTFTQIADEIIALVNTGTFTEPTVRCLGL